MAKRLNKPSDLAQELFLHDDSMIDDWQTWFAAAAPEQRIDTSGPTFSLYSLALQEAQNGAGILMGHAPLVSASLDDGSLVAPFDSVVELPRRLVIATPAPPRKGSLVAQIIDSIRNQP